MPFSHSNGHIITILYIELELGFGLTLSSLQSLLIAGSHSTKAYFSDLKQEIPKQKKHTISNEHFRFTRNNKLTVNIHKWKSYFKLKFINFYGLRAEDDILPKRVPLERRLMCKDTSKQRLPLRYWYHLDPKTSPILSFCISVGLWQSQNVQSQ